MKIVAALCLALALAGCASILPQPATSRQALLALDEWAFSGRVSLTRGETGWHAGLNWREQGGEYHLQVAGPLGQGAFELNGDRQGVELIDAEQRVFTARDADALLAHVTGWALPVSGMHYWVRGLAAPGGESREQRDEAGRLVRLEQAGWVIGFDRYRSVAGISLPGRLRLARDDISVRLVIDEWLLPETFAQDP